MVFCFPCKSLGKNFKEDNGPPKAKSAPASAANGKTEAKPVETTPAAAASNAAAESKPRVAIIIYSMYGHIAGSKSRLLNSRPSCSPSLTIVAEAVKGGVEKAGGKVTIYQCVPRDLHTRSREQHSHHLPQDC